MKITLTGAAGKLGSQVCRHLVEAGHAVRATDKFYRRDLPVSLEIADLLRPETAYGLLEGTEALVHLANHPHFHGNDAQRVFNENVTMNMNVFQAASEVGVKKIVFSSSIQVLAGNATDRPPYLPFDSATPANPGNPYALSKQVAETMLAYYAKRAGMDGIAIRFPWLVDDALLEMMKNPRRSPLDNPHEAFSFLHQKDAAALINAALVASLSGFRLYFVAARQNRLHKPITELLPKYYAGVPLRVPAEEMNSLVDIAQVTKETGWAPQFSDL